jgi:glycosyltransferase involved in cell wall biosynthesis
LIKFSVVISLYNKEKEIKDTLISVLNQTYKADEIIVVDDGSTDNSKEIVKRFKEVKLIEQENCGVSCARNRGIVESKNEYICFLDADDLWEQNFLEEIKILIESFPQAIFYSTSHKMIDENRKVIQSKSLNNFFGIVDNFFQTFNNNYGLINSSSVCIRKSANILFPVGEKKGEDICIWIEFALKGKLAHSSKPLSIYKLDASNRSGDIHKEPIIPCQLKWIYKNRDRVTKDIVKFVHKNILVTVYGNDRKFAKKIIDFMKKNGDLFWILLIFKFIIPQNILDIVKNIRRKF